MPNYQYRCSDCGAELEVYQKFTDDALTVCPECEGTLRKVYSAVGVVFKGSGFYATDNRKGKPSDSKKSESKSEKKPETPKTESKPAKTESKASSTTS